MKISFLSENVTCICLFFFKIWWPKFIFFLLGNWIKNLTRKVSGSHAIKLVKLIVPYCIYFTVHHSSIQVSKDLYQICMLKLGNRFIEKSSACMSNSVCSVTSMVDNQDEDAGAVLVSVFLNPEGLRGALRI